MPKPDTTKETKPWDLKADGIHDRFAAGHRMFELCLFRLTYLYHAVRVYMFIRSCDDVCNIYIYIYIQDFESAASRAEQS